jgi:NAD+ synthase (glutamine-hydrolysing)
MSHYNVNGGVAKTLIQHLIRWVVKTKQFDEGACATLLSILGTEISPELVPADATGAIQSPRPRSAPTSCRTSTSSTSPASAAALEGGVPGLARLARRGAGRLARRTSREDAQRLRPGDDQEVAGRLPVPLLRDQPVQALGHAQRPEGDLRRRLSPRGDWRAPSDGTARVWLDELEANVP